MEVINWNYQTEKEGLIFQNVQEMQNFFNLADFQWVSKPSSLSIPAGLSSRYLDSGNGL